MLQPPEPPSQVHLNVAACVIKHSEGKGRGVYASRPLPRQTILEASPVILFSQREYEEHGRFTVLDQYTFKWPDGRMALALGLGSLFNHSETPNVSYFVDPSTDSIQYVTVRDVEDGEELCIFYGHNLWFQPSRRLPSENFPMTSTDADDGWGGLLAVDDSAGTDNPYRDGDADETILEEQLPFTRFKLPPEEEDIDTICTVQAWVVNIPDQQLIARILKWLKQVGLDTPDLGHLKRIRKQGNVITLLLTTSPTPPVLPEDLELHAPYILPVPASPALTPLSLSLKSSLWPTVYAPSRKNEADSWTRGKCRWAWEAMKVTLEAAAEGKSHNELPIAAHIPLPYEVTSADGVRSSFTACDSRTSNTHPLRHAIVNVIRQMADFHASTNIAPSGAPAASLLPTTPGDPRNGTTYLLTSLALFTTHEPCIMCSMALIHSRVKEVFYLYPMAQTGGCGGVACLPTLRGVNHRFGICQWKAQGIFSECSLGIDAALDA